MVDDQAATEREQLLDRTLGLADKVTRELLPLTPKEVLALDVTTAQLKVMFALYLRGPSRIGVLARRQGVALPTMTVLVDRLVRRGILVREEDAGDRRVVLCRLSDRGREVIDQLWSSAKARTREILSVLSLDELKSVCATLEVLHRAGQATRSRQATDEETEGVMG